MKLITSRSGREFDIGPGDELRRWRRGRLGLWDQLLWPLVRAYAHSELPRYGHLLHWWGMNDQPRWSGAPAVEVRERLNGHRVRLMMSDYFQRINYFFGCWHELDVMSAITALLRPGDVFVDGGANIGLVSLHAAARVGPGGQVLSFEPNPRVYEQLCANLAMNEMPWVRAVRAGLGEERAVMRVRLPGFDNAAAATLGHIPQRYGEHIDDLGEVEVVRGDDVLDQDDRRPLMVKLDVEGFEHKAVRGLLASIRRTRAAVLLELNGEMLVLNGSGPEALFDEFAALGYRLYGLDRGGFRSRHRLWLHPLERRHTPYEKDAIFIHPASVFHERAARFIQPAGRYWRHHAMAKAGHPV